VLAHLDIGSGSSRVSVLLDFADVSLDKVDVLDQNFRALVLQYGDKLVG